VRTFLLVAAAALFLAFLAWVLGGFLASVAFAMPTKLIYTVPDRGQHCYMVLSPEGDSVRVCDCVGTESISQVRKVYLWGARLTGGGFAVRDSHLWADAALIEGKSDTFPVPFAGNFYIEAFNPVGRSCVSNVTTVYPDAVTGVPEDATPPAKEQRWYDIHGRLHTKRPTASGVYFWQYRLNGYWSKARKDVILRGVP
jgi:hypothetical protein